MCLIKFTEGFNVAQDGIKVWKVLKKKNDVLLSINYHMEYLIGNENESEIVESKWELLDQEEYLVFQGLHAFTSMDSALMLLESPDSTKEWIVCEALIPKGSRYAEGICGDIVSDRLLVVRECSI